MADLGDIGLAHTDLDLSYIDDNEDYDDNSSVNDNDMRRGYALDIEDDQLVDTIKWIEKANAIERHHS